MQRPVPIYIVASPNPKVGKTLIASLLIEFVQSDGRRVIGYDLQSRRSALSQDFLASGIECDPIRIARLSYLVRRVIDRANFSFASYITETGGESEIHQWVGPI